MTAKPQTDRPLPRGESEDARRRQLIEATIDTLAEVGFAATTLALIGQRAGVSPGLIAHYFDDKDGLLEATLRQPRDAPLARRPRAAEARRRRRATRVQAIIDATLAPEEFDQRTCSVWLAFWGAGHPFGAAEARPERLSAAHALQSPLRAAAARARCRCGAARDRDRGA